MNKIYQTKFGGSKDPTSEQGNCFQACIATIFGISIEDAFDPIQFSDSAWWGEFQKWLADFGLGCVAIEPGGCGGSYGLYLQQLTSTTLYKGDSHVVVAYMNEDDIQILHDPNPHAQTLGDFELSFIFTPLCQEKFKVRQNHATLL